MISDKQYHAAVNDLSERTLAGCLLHAADEDENLAAKYPEIAPGLGMSAEELIEVRQSVSLGTLVLIGMLRWVRKLWPRLRRELTG